MLEYSNINTYKTVLQSTSSIYQTQSCSIQVYNVSSVLPEMFGLTKQAMVQIAVDNGWFYHIEEYVPSTSLERLQQTVEGTPTYVDSRVVARCIMDDNGSDMVKLELCRFLGVSDNMYYTYQNSKEFCRQLAIREAKVRNYEQTTQQFNEVCSSRGCNDRQVSTLNCIAIQKSLEGPNNTDKMKQKLGIPDSEPLMPHATNAGLDHFTNVKQTSITNIESKNLNGFQDINKEVINVSKSHKEPFRQMFDGIKVNGLDPEKHTI